MAYRSTEVPEREAVECKHCAGTRICIFTQQDKECPICSEAQGLAKCKVCQGTGYTYIESPSKPTTAHVTLKRLPQYE